MKASTLAPIVSRSLVTLFLLVLGIDASATTIVVPTDEQLIDKSPVIVVGEVLSSYPVVRGGGVRNETKLAVREVLKGPRLHRDNRASDELASDCNQQPVPRCRHQRSGELFPQGTGARRGRLFRLRLCRGQPVRGPDLHSG